MYASWTMIAALALLLCTGYGHTSEAAANPPATSPAPKDPKQAIEQFLSLTAIWMLELEWTHAYVNKTPKAEDFGNVMLAAGLHNCPADFQEAWIKQANKPGRNYAAPVIRKYGISLADLRERLQGKLFKINPLVHPPIPLYDEDEKIPRLDPRSCGKPQDILNALATLKAQVMGISPTQMNQFKQAIDRVMLEFMLAYMETSVCINAAGILESQVKALFTPINTTQCPKDFQEAWEHDLPFFLKGQFNGTFLQLSPVCKKYGINEQDILLKVRKKMAEWDIQAPTPQTQDSFRKDMQEVRENLLGGK